jgi:hypothetical protein
MTSPTQRSLANLRGRGYLPTVTEHWNQHARIRQDLYGFIDIVALRADINGVLGVQTTTASNLGARIKKAEKIKAFGLWIAAGNTVEFHGWQKKEKSWEVKIVKYGF